MPYYTTEGRISLIPQSAEISNKLKVGTYTVVQDRDSKSFYLEVTKDMEDSKGLFGLEERAQRVVKTFLDRKRSTGVLAKGPQGTGKTELVRCISNLLRKRGIPTVLVNGAFRGPEFIQFMTDITDECFVVFDEFEKNFSMSDQNQLLTLFSGVSSGKKLYLLTANDGNSISKYFNSRPGRILYSFTMTGLGPDDIRAYCETHLKNKSHLEDLVAFAQSKVVFTVDMLESVIEEMNRYNESIEDIKEFINIADISDYACYVGLLVNKDGLIVCSQSIPLNSTPPQLNNRQLNFRVLITEFTDHEGKIVKLEKPQDSMELHTVKHSNLFALNRQNKTYIYKSTDGKMIALLQSSLFGTRADPDDWQSRNVISDEQQAEILNTIKNHPWFNDDVEIMKSVTNGLTDTVTKAMSANNAQTKTTSPMLTSLTGL